MGEGAGGPGGAAGVDRASARLAAAAGRRIALPWPRPVARLSARTSAVPSTWPPRRSGTRRRRTTHGRRRAERAPQRGRPQRGRAARPHAGP
eukprot:1468238-Prymnesium_polylepis.1